MKAARNSRSRIAKTASKLKKTKAAFIGILGSLFCLIAEKIRFAEQVGGIDFLFDPTLAANEMKVRITGTITLITNNHLKDRSFRFLDTFNKKDGKWEMIATGLALTSESSTDTDKRSIEARLTDLEKSLSAAGDDRSVIESMIAADFVGTTEDGVLQTRNQLLTSMAPQNLKTAEINNVDIRLVSDAVAVVTGVKLTNRADGLPGKERFTHTWLNRDGRWQLVASQQTRVP